MNHFREVDGVIYTLPNKRLAAQFDSYIEDGVEADLEWAEKYLALPDPSIKMTKKELTKRKTTLTHHIVNIRADYSTVAKEDIPEDVTEELKKLMEELQDVKQKLAAG